MPYEQLEESHRAERVPSMPQVPASLPAPKQMHTFYLSEELYYCEETPQTWQLL